MKHFNLNSLLIIISTGLLLLTYTCNTGRISTQMVERERTLVNQLSTFSNEARENTRTYKAEVLTYKKLINSLKNELNSLEERIIINNRRLKDLQSSITFISDSLKSEEIHSPRKDPEVIVDNSSALLPDSSTENNINIYEGYIQLPIGSQWSFEDNLLKGNTTLLQSGDASTKYNIKPIQFDVDIYRKGRLFKPDLFTADITSSALPIGAASVTLKKIPRPRLVFGFNASYNATWDGNKVIYGPSVGAGITMPIFTILSK